MAAEIYIDGYILNKVDAEKKDTTLESVRDQYDSQPFESELNVYVKSYGGDVREGWAIYDYLQLLGKPITTIATGEVYSIATVDFLAAQKGRRKAYPNAKFMLHNPWARTEGDAATMEKTAAMLRKEETILAEFYARETGQDVEFIRSLMDVETYLTATEAFELGFVDEILQEVRAYAKWTPKDSSNSIISKMDHTPTKWERFLALFEGTEVSPVKAQTVELDISNAPVVEIADQTAIDALQSEVDALKAELEALKAAPAPELAPELAEAVAFAVKYAPVMAKMEEFLKDEATPATTAKPVTRTSAQAKPVKETPAAPANAFQALAAKANQFSK